MVRRPVCRFWPSREGLLYIIFAVAAIACAPRFYGSSSSSSLAFAVGARVVVAKNSTVNLTVLSADGYSGFTISPTLPAGLAMSSSTGAITGTPTVLSPATDYTVTAVRAGVSATFALNLRVVDFEVNDASDGAAGFGDTSPGDGACVAITGGLCTLRAAVEESDVLAGAQTLTIPANMTISLAAVIPINADIEITGNSQTTTILDGGSAVRMLLVNTTFITVSFSYFTIQNGSSAFGAAITGDFNTDNIYSFSHVTFANNVATQAGPAIYVFTNSTVTIDNCIFDSNHTNGGFGGGAIHTNSPVTITNSTFTGNYTFPTGTGGAIRTSGAIASTISNTTFYNNSSPNSTTALNINSPGSVTLTNNTFAGNTGVASALVADTVTASNNIFFNNTTDSCQVGAMTSNGGNLVFPAEADCNFIHASDIPSADPLLGALSYNGGSVPTLALSPSSPAINTGVNGSCTTTDARGVTRPQGGVCDSGAYEAE